MSGEKLPIQDSKEQIQHKESKEHLEKIKSKVEKGAEEAGKLTEKEVTEARKTIESEAISGKETTPNRSEKKSQQAITKAEKTRTYKMTMQRAQNQMSKPSKAFSKFIHNPAVERTSDTLSATVARPSGILGAGVMGFIGISVVLYYARQNGFAVDNRYTLVIGLFIGGWILGMIFEFIFKSFKKLAN